MSYRAALLDLPIIINHHLPVSGDYYIEVRIPDSVTTYLPTYSDKAWAHTSYIRIYGALTESQDSTGATTTQDSDELPAP